MGKKEIGKIDEERKERGKIDGERRWQRANYAKESQCYLERNCARKIVSETIVQKRAEALRIYRGK